MERIAGYPRPDSAVTIWEYQTLMIVEQLIEHEELAIRQQIGTGLAMLMSGLGIKPKGT